MVGAKHPAPPLGLITVAAMLPPTWDIRLIDHNIEELSDTDLEWADLVMTGGMLPQQLDALKITDSAHAAGRKVVIGGPDITSSPAIYEAADYKVLGEAEEIISELIAAIERDEPAGTFEAEKFETDVTKSPIPRFDLLKFENYVQVGLQFSRGCPFTCEFCDIIELYGRRPRTKTAEQLLAELDALYGLGYRGHVDLVDDNLIGNKKAVKAFLPKLRDWQIKNRFPFEFSTEASLNLADDDELLKMLTGAAFFAIFIGIESPDMDVLKATGKKQNIKHDITERIHKIYGAGIFVLAGFILGFDNENEQIAASMIDLIERTAIPVCMVGLLYALPNTQLTRRLEREGRLHGVIGIDVQDGRSADQCTTGLNFETVRPRAEIFQDFRKTVKNVYDPANYCERVFQVATMLDLSGPPGALYLSRMVKDIRQFSRILVAMTFNHPAFRGYFWTTLLRCIVRNPRSIKPVLKMLALYAHLGPFAQFVDQSIGDQMAAVTSGQTAPRLLAVS